MGKILVTGASGFIGQALVQSLVAQKFDVIAGVRKKPLSPVTKQLVLGDLSEPTDYGNALQGLETIIHLAARVHIMQDTSSDALAEFRKINTSGTINLALQAAQSGVKRFIFISSIKVNGESTPIDSPFQAEITGPPTDPYALSKYETEQGLLSLAKKTSMDVVIIRPPLVYGPGVKGNFPIMVDWIRKGIPLPFGIINNQRSFVALQNLVNFISVCVTHKKAANEIFLISDGVDVSTTQVLHKIAETMHQNLLLLPIPVSWMCLAARIIAKQDVANRLFSSLTIDNSKARKLLGWHPVITMDEQLRIMALSDQL